VEVWSGERRRLTGLQILFPVHFPDNIEIKDPGALPE